MTDGDSGSPKADLLSRLVGQFGLKFSGRLVLSLFLYLVNSRSGSVGHSPP